jgi:hypothetical protein
MILVVNSDLKRFEQRRRDPRPLELQLFLNESMRSICD